MNPFKTVEHLCRLSRDSVLIEMSTAKWSRFSLDYKKPSLIWAIFNHEKRT